MMSKSDIIACASLVATISIGVVTLLSSSETRCDLLGFRWGCSEHTLNAGDRLSIGQQLESSNGCFMLMLQDDGNLVLYNKQGTALWSTETFQQKSKYAVMQRDGHFVIYSEKGSVVWGSNTYGTRGRQLKIENDGNMAIYTLENEVVWATNTGGRSCE